MRRNQYHTRSRCITPCRLLDGTYQQLHHSAALRLLRCCCFRSPPPLAWTSQRQRRCPQLHWTMPRCWETREAPRLQCVRRRALPVLRLRHHGPWTRRLRENFWARASAQASPSPNPLAQCLP